MVIVIAVIAILAAAMIPAVSGVIRQANISADRQFAASLNIQLAMWEVDNGEIASESNLRDAINDFYGKWEDEEKMTLAADGDFYAALEPKSGKYGYHYWWNATDKQVVLAKYEELLPDDGAAPTEVGILSFSPASPRSLLIPTAEGEKNFFLMDRGEGELAQLMTSFENLHDEEQDPASKFEEALTNIYELAEQKGNASIEAQILEKLKVCAVITDAGVFRYDYEDLSEVKGVYIPVTTKTLVSTNVHTYTITDGAEEPVKVKDGQPAGPGMKVIDSAVVFELPSGITVNTNGLFGFANASDATDMLTETPTVLVSDNDLTKIFAGYATDCVVQTPDGSRYVILPGQDAQGAFVAQYFLLPLAENPADRVPAGSLGAGGVSVNDKVEIAYTHITNQMVYDPAGKILYVAYDEGGVQLNVKNPVLANLVTWSVPENNGLMTIGSDGKVTFTALPAVGSDDETASVTVMASVPVVNGEPNKDTLTIRVCRVNNADFTIAGTEDPNAAFELPATDEEDTEITIVYDGNENFAISTPSLGYNGFDPDELAITFPNAKLTPTTSGSLFAIDTACTTLTVDKDQIKNYPNGQEVTFQYKVGTTVYAEETYTIKIKDNSSKQFSVQTGPDGNPLSSKYLYRVGNSGEIKLGQLFVNDKPADAITLEIIDVATNAAVGAYNESSNAGTVGASYTKPLTSSNWADSTIKFSGTGIVTVKISTEKGTTPVHLEIVDGTNYNAGATISSGSTNIVLLGNASISGGGTLTLSGKSFYGNGYTFDVSGGKNTGTGDSENGLVLLKDSILDNVKIVGPQYTSFNITAKAENVRATVLASGKSGIYNSFISNGAAAVRILTDADVMIENTTLWGGSYANLDVRGGHTTVKDLTTFNQYIDDATTPAGSVGAGVVFWYEYVPADTTFTVEGTLKQYNVISSKQKDSFFKGFAKDIAGSFFSNELAAYKYSADSDTWINMGIVSASDTLDINKVVVPGVTGSSVKVSVTVSGLPVSREGYLWSTKPTAETYKAFPAEWKPTAQQIIAPAETLTYPDGKPQTGSNVYCYLEGEQLLISFDEVGGSRVFDPNVLTATKHGNTLEYTVTIDGDDYTDKTIIFNKDNTGTHTMLIKYKDPYNYAVVDGALTKTDKWYDHIKVEIVVTAVKATAKDAQFKFFGYTSESKTAANTITDVKTATDNAGNIWIMPSSTNGTSITSTTKNGITINTPRVHVGFKDNSSDFNWLYPMFLAFEITDYADGGTGDKFTVVSPTSNSKPANLTVINPDKKGDGTIPGWSDGSGKSGSEGELGSGTYKNLYGWTGGAVGSDKPETSFYGQFTYKSEKGTVYNILVEFYRAAHTCPTTCVTPETLVTLADGSQKMIKDVTKDDYLLAWNFITGQYEVAPIISIVNHGWGNYEVLTLYFDDGTSLNVIAEHGVFDADLKEFAFITVDNVADYLGHTFVKDNGGELGYTKLIDYSVEVRKTESYSIASTFFVNCFLEGLFTQTPPEVGNGNFYMPFELGDDMKFDEEKMAADIEKYGLFTYEDFAAYMPKEMFDAVYTIPYIKVSVGKGLVTLEEYISIFERYVFG